MELDDNDMSEVVFVVPSEWMGRFETKAIEMDIYTSDLCRQIFYDWLERVE